MTKRRGTTRNGLTLAVSLVIIMGLSSCRDGESASLASLSLFFVAPTSAVFGDSTEFSLSIMNPTNSELTVPLASVPEWAFDIVVTQENEVVVWRRLAVRRPCPRVALFSARNSSTRCQSSGT
jgi:hypothetical protein